HARADPLLLTARQRRILDLLCEGLSNREMAARLCRSERTVEGHVAALLARLGVRGRAEAVALAAATTFGGQAAARVRRPVPRRH
ncbi:MAG: response regulator transcription factor, partial [Ideonella sp.]|nr:response regulator transcription factor [Ideonella sp.]